MLLFWILVAGFAYVIYKNYQKDVENMKKDKKDTKLDKLKRKLKAEKEEEKSRVEMICEIKDRILEQFEKDNPEKVIELTQLWLKYKENKQEEKEKVTKKVSYKLGSALSGIVSGFKEGVNND